MNIERALRGIAGVMVLVSAALAHFHHPYWLFLTAFVSPWLLHKGQHVRIDLVLQQVPAVVGWCFEIFVDCLGIVVSALLTWYGIRELHVSMVDGTKIAKFFTIPEWWTLWPLPMMFILLALEFCFRLLRVVKGPRRPRNEGASI